MSKLQSFCIQFQKSDATYEPGEIVTGLINLHLSSSKNLREIRLEARGEAEVHWTKNRNLKDSSGRSHHHMDHFRGSEHYFSISNRLIGSTTGDGYITLPSGHHSYHFSFQLPTNIPCSIEHKFGHVRYTVKAILDRPWRFDHKVVSAFTVISPYDLNTEQRLVTGINEEIKRNFCCCCILRMGGIKFNIKSKVSGFVPGETIELTINYDNNSTQVDLTKIKLKLQKHLQFFSSSPFRDEKESFEIIKTGKKCGVFGKKGETSIKILVPPLPPSRLEYCSLINVKYDIILTIFISGMHFNIYRTYPLEIGTIPLYYRTANLLQNSLRPYVPLAPPICQINSNIQQIAHTSQPIGFIVMSAPFCRSDVSQSIPNIPPPSYEECISGNNNIVDQNEHGIHRLNVQFSPKYPVYKFPMPLHRQ